MASISGANIINYDYLLRNCYSSNRSARNSSGRSSFSKAELLSADSDALRRLTKNLEEISYDKDDGKNIYNNAKALIETYTNTIGSADKISSAELENSVKKMKQFVKDNKEALEAIGIKVSSTGKMELDKDKMLETSAEKMKKMFSASGDFSKTLNKYAKKINSISKKLLKEEVAAKKSAEERENLTLGTLGTTTSPNSIDFRA